MSFDVGEVKERLENELCYVTLAIVRLASKENLSAFILKQSARDQTEGKSK